MPSGNTFVVDAHNSRVYGVTAGERTVHVRDEIGEALGDVRRDDLLAVAHAFEALWKWPSFGTRFPPRPAGAAAFPSGCLHELGGRLNVSGTEGDLEFGGYLDRVERERLAAGKGVRVSRTALERHLCALDYGLEGKLGLIDLYKAFVAHRVPPLQASVDALGAWVFFGHCRAVDIARIAERRPATRTGGFDAHGQVDPEVLRQYRRLFDSAPSGEIEQTRLARFNENNLQVGIVSKRQWQTFFKVCSALNQRKTVTYAQLVGLFEGSFAFVAASKVDASGRRGLDRVLAD